LLDAVGTDDAWQDGLGLVADGFRALDAQVLLRDGATACFLGAPRHLSLEGQVDYLQRWVAFDPRKQLADRLPTGTVVACNDHFDERYVDRSRFYREFLIPDGGRYALGARVVDDPDVTAYVIVHRAVRQQPFDKADQETFAGFLPIVSRCIRLHANHRRAQALVAAVNAGIDASPDAVLIIDRFRHIHLANAVAERLLRCRDGLETHVRMLRCRDRATDERLSQLLARSLDGQSGGGSGTIKVERTSGKPDYILRLSPIRNRIIGASGNTETFALVTVLDQESRPMPLGRMLIDLFLLTQAEAQVAIALASGKSPTEIAAERGLKMPTVRTQVRQVLEKLEKRRQADLVTFLVRLGGLSGAQ
jgi:DNA-binding CsgD family transcriptional regulator